DPGSPAPPLSSARQTRGSAPAASCLCQSQNESATAPSALRSTGPPAPRSSPSSPIPSASAHFPPSSHHASTQPYPASVSVPPSLPATNHVVAGHLSFWRGPALRFFGRLPPRGRPCGQLGNALSPCYSLCPPAASLDVRSGAERPMPEETRAAVRAMET